VGSTVEQAIRVAFKNEGWNGGKPPKTAVVKVNRRRVNTVKMTAQDGDVINVK